MAPFQWAIYIGPPWHDAASPYYFDWPSYNKDAASTLSAASTVATTLVSGAVSVVLANTGSFASKGGVWLGPGGSGESWEYCEYTNKVPTNTLTGLTREPTVDRDHNGIHSVGAAARLWWPLAENDGKLNINFSLDDLSVASDWQFEISGIKAPQAAFQPLHLAIIQYRQAVTGTLTNFLVGFMDSGSIQDDARSTRGWSAKFASVGMMLRRTQVEGVRVGNFDLALAGEATSTVPLAAPHKERWTGDFTPAKPNFDASIVLQEEDDGIWIGDRLIGTTEDPASYSGLSQIYINPPASINAGSKWFEFIWRDTASTEIIAWDSVSGSQVHLDLPSLDINAGERVIVAENEVVFLRENPTQEAVAIFDVSGSDNPGFFNHLWPAGGGMAFNFFGSFSSGVFWGTTTPGDAGFAGAWVGPSLPAPKRDETMRWKANDHGHANTKDDWEVSMRQSPGYRIHNNTRGEQAWLAVTLPGMGLILHDDIDAVNPAAGSFLAIDGQNGPSTDGLANPGDIVVGDEVIRYINKTATNVQVSERGAYGTTAVAHKASDAVFVFHTQNGRLSVTDAMPIRALIWERPAGSSNYPRDFNWRYSALEARTPDAEQHEDDYEFYQPVADYAFPSMQLTLAQARVKTILLEFKRMAADPSRPRINRLKALVDESYFDSSLWLDEGTSIEGLMQRILLNAGLSTSAIQIIANGVAPSGFTTAIDMAWNVIASAAELGNSMIKIDRDSKVILQPDNLWRVPVGTYAPSKTWTRSNAGNVQFSRIAGATASQVKLHWKLPDGSDSGVAKYPATPAALGAEQEIGPLYFASKADADLAARKRFYLARYPYELVVSLAQGDLTVEPHQIHRVQWPLAEDGQQIDRLILVRQVQHSISNQLLATVLHGIVIDQEWEV
jgi:hypothetical protein